MKYQIEKETAKDANNYKRPSKYVAPTYISPILNRVNGWSCATRPATVGAIATDVFPSFIAKSENRSQEGWKEEAREMKRRQQTDPGLSRFFGR
jgi:hypothetical protein